MGLCVYARARSFDRIPKSAEYDIATIRKAIKAPVGRKAIQWIKVNAPEWLPKITRARGEKLERLFWQSGGGYDRNVITPVTVLKMIDYIHRNPIRRELVVQACQWKWSSAAWYIHRKQTPVPVDRVPAYWLDQ